MKLKDYKYHVDYTWMKSKGLAKETFDLTDPAQRTLYFNAKAGEEMEKLREFFKNNTFIAFMLAPKQAGKGTYLGIMKEVFGDELFTDISVGNLVREADTEFQAEGKKSDVYKYAEQNYRGPLSLDQVFEDLVNRSTSTLRPTEFILTLIKMAIEKIGRKTIFIDGFPRNIDQVSTSLYFRDLINFRNDPDLFILINIPLALIDIRISGRRYCPKCNNSKNIMTNPTTKVKYDEEKKEFYFLCDNPYCTPTRMLQKEGDNEGIKIIEDRIALDLDVMKQARKMHGIPKIEVYNSISQMKANEYLDEYEKTPRFNFKMNKLKEVIVNSEPYSFEENGERFVSLLPAPVVLQMVRQLAAMFC